MTQGSGRRVFPFFYLSVVTAVFGLLVLVGSVIDRIPLLPATVGRVYRRFMFGTVFGLARPFDGWMDRPADIVAGGVPGESAP